MNYVASHIQTLVQHNGGYALTARKLKLAPQMVQSWVYRGYASPMHVLGLEPLLPKGMTIRHLLLDRQNNNTAKRKRRAA